MLIDFSVKSLTECVSVGVIACGNGSTPIAFSEPEMKLIKKVKAGPVHQAATGRLIFMLTLFPKEQDRVQALVALMRA